MNSVVIVAGGSGSRMKSAIPKQFIQINGKPLILWTIDKFLLFDSKLKVIIVLPENHITVWQEIVEEHSGYEQMIVCSGGASRFDSVQNGLAHVKAGEIVGIHDAVRPLVSVDTIKRCYAMAEIKNSAIPVINMEDSLRIESSSGNEILDRSKVRRVQTPQVFNAEKLIMAYEKCFGKNYTDDASVFESYVGSVQLVEGNHENIKITYPADIKIAESTLI